MNLLLLLLLLKWSCGCFFPESLLGPMFCVEIRGESLGFGFLLDRPCGFLLVILSSCRPTMLFFSPIAFQHAVCFP